MPSETGLSALSSDLTLCSPPCSLRRVEREHNTSLVGQHFSVDPQGALLSAYPPPPPPASRSCHVPSPASTPGRRILLGNLTVGEANLQNGDMIYIQVDEEISGIHEASQTSRFITKEGNIVAQSYDESSNKLGFRPGMMALRDIKKQWTLREFESLDSQFVYKIKKAENPVCKIASLDQNSLDSFQAYMRNFNFQRLR